MVELPPPVPGVITQYPSPEHQAHDFACLVGTPVVATHEGTVKRFRDGRLGNQVRIVGPDGFETLYAHLDGFESHGYVQQGDVIGYCGNTGSWSTGPHLHFEANFPYRF